MGTFFEVSNRSEGVLNCSNVSSFAFVFINLNSSALFNIHNMYFVSRLDTKLVGRTIKNMKNNLNK